MGKKAKSLKGWIMKKDPLKALLTPIGAIRYDRMAEWLVLCFGAKNGIDGRLRGCAQTPASLLPRRDPQQKTSRWQTAYKRTTASPTTRPCRSQHRESRQPPFSTAFARRDCSVALSECLLAQSMEGCGVVSGHRRLCDRKLPTIDQRPRR